MDQKLKNDWIEALESGKYIKGIGSLSANGQFCCLGVLCEVANVSRKLNSTKEFLLYNFGTETSTAYLGETFMRDIGLDQHSASHLAALNDNSDSFEPVIQYIKENIS